MMSAKFFFIKNYGFIFIAVLILLFGIFLLVSCALPFTSAVASETDPAFQAGQGANLATSSGEFGPDPEDAVSGSGEGLSLFDYTVIELTPAGVLDLEIKNCNVYQDIYGDLVILGEMLNNSEIIKTNIDITLSFLDKNKNIIDDKKIPAYAEYLQSGRTMPFAFVYENKSQYINISEIKIGVNYKNYNKGLEGYPVVAEEGFSYDSNMLTINGNIFNLGVSKIEDLRLLCTFYNKKNQVVFIRQCFVKNESLEVLEKQDFSISILIDEYIKEFTDYNLEVFYRDALKA